MQWARQAVSLIITMGNPEESAPLCSCVTVCNTVIAVAFPRQPHVSGAAHVSVSVQRRWGAGLGPARAIPEDTVCVYTWGWRGACKSRAVSSLLLNLWEEIRGNLDEKDGLSTQETRRWGMQLTWVLWGHS